MRTTLYCEYCHQEDISEEGCDCGMGRRGLSEYVNVKCPHCGRWERVENTLENFEEGYICPVCGEPLGISPNIWILDLEG